MWSSGIWQWRCSSLSPHTCAYTGAAMDTHGGLPFPRRKEALPVVCQVPPGATSSFCRSSCGCGDLSIWGVAICWKMAAGLLCGSVQAMCRQGCRQKADSGSGEIPQGESGIRRPWPRQLQVSLPKLRADDAVCSFPAGISTVRQIVLN